MTSSARPLLIGIGNGLRGDDGVGYRLAELLIEEGNSPLQICAQQQLTPELAVLLAHASRVLFVDAALPGYPMGLRPLLPAATSDPLSHQLQPPQLLVLAQQLFGHCPPAWQLLLPAVQFDHGDQLSREAAEALREALPLVLSWGDHHA